MTENALDVLTRCLQPASNHLIVQRIGWPVAVNERGAMLGRVVLSHVDLYQAGDEVLVPYDSLGLLTSAGQLYFVPPEKVLAIWHGGQKPQHLVVA